MNRWFQGFSIFYLMNIRLQRQWTLAFNDCIHLVSN